MKKVTRKEKVFAWLDKNPDAKADTMVKKLNMTRASAYNYKKLWRQKEVPDTITLGEAVAMKAAVRKKRAKRPIAPPPAPEPIVTEVGRPAYGDFLYTAAVSQELYTALARAANANELILMPDQTEALHMICVKLARIVNGDPNNANHWEDLAGYAKLVLSRLRG